MDLLIPSLEFEEDSIKNDKDPLMQDPVENHQLLEAPLPKTLILNGDDKSGTKWDLLMEENEKNEFPESFILGKQKRKYYYNKKCYNKCYFRCNYVGILHCFPSYTPLQYERFLEWCSILDPTTRAKREKYIAGNVRLCDRHFEKHYILPNGTLTRNAVPTLNLQLDKYASFSSKKRGRVPAPTTKFSNNVNINAKPNHKEGIDVQSTVLSKETYVDTEFISSEYSPKETSDREVSYDSETKITVEASKLKASRKKIHPDLVTILEPILLKGLEKEAKEKLLEDYQIPANCKLLKAPILNPEISEVLNKETKVRDNNKISKQHQLGLGITTVQRAMTELLYGEKDLAKIFNILSDSCIILSDLHYLESQARIESVSRNFGDMSVTVEKLERNQYLIGI